MITAEWVGLKEANAALKRLPEHVKPAVQQVMDVTAFQVSRGAQSRAPRRTGVLVKSIQWQSRPRSLSAVVGVLPEAFYWKFLEYGTVKMGSRPFMRPAAVAMEADHENRLVQALAQTLTVMEREAR